MSRPDGRPRPPGPVAVIFARESWWCERCGQSIQWRERVWYVDTGRVFLMIHEHCPTARAPTVIDGGGRTTQPNLPFLAAVEDTP